MDELNDLRAVVDEHGVPARPGLADELWPDIRATYRQVAASRTAAAAELHPLPLAENERRGRARAARWVRVAAVVVLVAVGLFAFESSRPETEIADPNNEVVPEFDAAVTCRSLEASLERADGEAAAVTTLEILDAIDDRRFATTNTVVARLRLAEGAFAQADAERDAGQNTAAAATEAFALDTLAALVDDTGKLPGCP